MKSSPVYRLPSTQYIRTLPLQESVKYLHEKQPVSTGQYLGRSIFRSSFTLGLSGWVHLARVDSRYGPFVEEEFQGCVIDNEGENTHEMMRHLDHSGVEVHPRRDAGQSEDRMVVWPLHHTGATHLFQS